MMPISKTYSIEAKHIQKSLLVQMGTHFYYPESIERIDDKVFVKMKGASDLEAHENDLIKCKPSIPIICNEIEQRGGRFAKALINAFKYADNENAIKIRTHWIDLFESYADLAMYKILNLSE